MPCRAMAMKLAAIYNVWDDFYLLQHSIDNIRPLVECVIVVFSKRSNFGEISEEIDGSAHKFTVTDVPIFFVQKEPDLTKKPPENERSKRNTGIQWAKDYGCTHFLMMDADEFYESEPFLKEKDRFLKNPDLAGLVCGLKCYFKSPTLCVEDKTLVPFIHKLTPEICATWNHRYPFAFEGPKKEIRIDPTRQLNINSGVEWSDIMMHHYSWIRNDYEKKIRNSTARANIEKSTILKDLLHAKPGYFCEFYGKTLEPCSDLFNLCQKLNVEPL